MNSNYTDEERRWRIINFKVLERNIAEAFKLFRNGGIEPILIKGWAVSRYYPQKYQRFFSDIDLAVAPADFDKAADLIEREKLVIDLHKSLKQLDLADWNDLYARTEMQIIEQTEIRVLAEEDHLRVLCVHWLTDGGAYREKLWDVYYAVKNRSEDFSWELCLGNTSRTRREWIVKTIGLAHKYLELDISDLPFADEAVRLPRWLTTAVEKEWESPTKLRPRHTCIHDRKEFARQILKRIPPNPVYSTVGSEGTFDEGSRLKYQLKSVLRRTLPSFGRVFDALRKGYSEIGRT